MRYTIVSACSKEAAGEAAGDLEGRTSARSTSADADSTPSFSDRQTAAPCCSDASTSERSEPGRRPITYAERRKRALVVCDRVEIELHEPAGMRKRRVHEAQMRPVEERAPAGGAEHRLPEAEGDSRSRGSAHGAMMSATRSSPAANVEASTASTRSTSWGGPKPSASTTGAAPASSIERRLEEGPSAVEAWRAAAN